ncbi:hypothetical protein B5M09_011136 [Aphanomyces astaci]|uniref:HTH CENPB-type domain-containing protein n=1 Tax=Aphanomyces astaci TaxID=112090 RepID=A0A425CGP1_APHAT|nr:hypothetical protein B5M09_011136 [Aphanomyces astaci]
MPRPTQRKPKKYKYSRYTYEQNHVILQYRDSHTAAETIDRFFHGTRTQRRRDTIYQLLAAWTKSRPTIEVNATDAITRDMYRTRQHGLGTKLTQETESFLWNWIQSMRSDGMLLSRDMLALHALDVAPFFEHNKPDFKASSSWCTRFMQSNALADRAVTRQSQKTPAETAVAIEAFSKQVQDLMTKYGADVVYNVDQTAIQHEEISKRTVNDAGASTV